MNCSALRVESGEHSGRLQLPGWVKRLLTGAAVQQEGVPGDRIIAQRCRHEHFQCISVVVQDAAALTPLDFQRATIEAYKTIRLALAEGPRHPVRFWNFIPGIGRSMNGQLNRYMVFNAGRHAAYMDWYRPRDAKRWEIATASGVGHRGRDLIIHCLASTRRGQAVENPRQIPAYRYSRRFGPFSPSFARATILPRCGPDPDRLLVGGTASIRGEQSWHLSNLQRQTDETLANLAAVIKTASTRSDAPTIKALDDRNDVGQWLSLLHSVRVYYVHDEHKRHLRQALAEHFNDGQDVEWVRADLCRPELLVEMEGMADLAASMTRGAVETDAMAMEPSARS